MAMCRPSLSLAQRIIASLRRSTRFWRGSRSMGTSPSCLRWFLLTP